MDPIHNEEQQPQPQHQDEQNLPADKQADPPEKDVILPEQQEALFPISQDEDTAPRPKHPIEEHPTFQEYGSSTPAAAAAESYGESTQVVWQEAPYGPTPQPAPPPQTPQVQPVPGPYDPYNSQPSWPGYPPQANTVPTNPYNPYASQPGVGSGINYAATSGMNYPPVAPAPASKPPKQPGKLARPLPLWGVLGGLGLLIVLFVVLHLTGSDWAAGSAHAAVAALLLGVLLLIALAVRMGDGMASILNKTRVRQAITSAIIIIVLFIYSGVAFSIQPSLHIAQAHSLENQQQWQPAIDEYTQGGEQAPDGADIARTYTSWGLALNKSQHYNEALTKFDTVIQKFTASSVNDELHRAQVGDIAARIGLSRQSLDTKDYDVASKSLDTVLGLPYCDNTCQAQASALDATAYYNIGEGKLQTQDYESAVNAFDKVLTKFSSAPEAGQLHSDMAKALLGMGKQERSSSCSTAIPTYQRLAKEYGDTNEGKSAQKDLNAPQDITGHFTNVESDVPFNQIGLTTGLKGGMGKDELFAKWDASKKTGIQGNGNFAFHGISQGSYDLIWYANNGSYEYVEFIYHQVSQEPTYVAEVGPLCPVNMGNVSNVHTV
ncbi:tetratricopeptide repeat protein [Ktedonobacter racemifer]|uniref:Tetratricopeptide repeat protein n=1 Tax=Ktedonobacter racemifer DSM 44963 TaxID=485913 RepID=D6TVS4_KTERA|nr:tetratricopeptide repeat protein [Ktedonobacter racemifer]EFH84307.1 hypothetical protein Krac_5334 [Ktedonobacter racemifer DSM 44963]